MPRPRPCFFPADAVKASLGHFGSMSLVSPQKPHSWGWGQLFHALKIKPTSSAWPVRPSFLLPGPLAPSGHPGSHWLLSRLLTCPRWPFPLAAPFLNPAHPPPFICFSLFYILNYESMITHLQGAWKIQIKVMYSFTIYYNQFLSR